ncbi:hypothetical protein CCYA_CCYA13G3510 [Cyanidiococcus yangmingshanensis]|nr:hypothetical protein CCYA_CCYA13G3510 [Cyanidiococcus yangmingshanensis]
MSHQQEDTSHTEASIAPRDEESTTSHRAGRAEEKPEPSESAPTGFRFVLPVAGKTSTVTSDQQGSAAASGVKSVFAAEGERDDHDQGGDTNDALGEEDASVSDWKPLVQLDLVQIKSGEEDEEILAKFRAKLYRFDKAMREWKERGTGEIKFLRHQTTGRVRLLMRRQQTLKICANHYLLPEMRLEENMGSDRSWVWTAIDYADEERDEAVLAIRFKDSETATRFHETFEKLRKQIAALLASEKTSTKPSSDH